MRLIAEQDKKTRQLMVDEACKRLDDGNFYCPEMRKYVENMVNYMVSMHGCVDKRKTPAK